MAPQNTDHVDTTSDITQITQNTWDKECTLPYCFPGTSQRDMTTHVNLAPENVQTHPRHARASLHMQMTPYVREQARSVEAAAADARAHGEQARHTTTLYDLIATMQTTIAPSDDDLVVGAVMHLLRTGRITLPKTRIWLEAELS